MKLVTILKENLVTLEPQWLRPEGMSYIHLYNCILFLFLDMVGRLGWSHPLDCKNGHRQWKVATLVCVFALSLWECWETKIVLEIGIWKAILNVHISIIEIHFFSKSSVLTLNYKNEISVSFGDVAEEKQNAVMMVSKDLVGSNGCLYFQQQNPFNTCDSSTHSRFWCVISLPWVFLKFFIWIVLYHEFIFLLTVYFYSFFDQDILSYINYLVALSL